VSEIVTLKRVAYRVDGVFGVLMYRNRPLCVTCEDPWKDNQRDISCIPEGKYACKPHDGMKFANVWRLMNVPNRSAILIHCGNTQKDTHGCILVGQSFTTFGDQQGIAGSQNAMKLLRDTLPTEFTLEIE
jgi:hypothetical protein